MRSNEIFAGMSGEEAERFLVELKQDAPDVAKLALGATAEAFRLRPEFLKRQPRARQAEWMRRALGRTIGAPLAEEVLATYFLDHEKDLLIELLDALGVPHKDGRLSQTEPECPDAKRLESEIKKFRKGAKPEKRELLLRAFAAQSSIEWPALDELLATGKVSASAALRPAPAPPAAAAPSKAGRKTAAKPKTKPKTKARPEAKARARAKPKAKTKPQTKPKAKPKGRAKKKAKRK